MNGDELFSSGVFASELNDDIDAPIEEEELDADDLSEDDDDDDDLDDDEASYNPLDDYKNEEWA